MIYFYLRSLTEIAWFSTAYGYKLLAAVKFIMSLYFRQPRLCNILTDFSTPSKDIFVPAILLVALQWT